MLHPLLLIALLYTHTIATTWQSVSSLELSTESTDNITTTFRIETQNDDTTYNTMVDHYPSETTTQSIDYWSLDNMWFEEWPVQWRTAELFPFYSALEDRKLLSERLLSNYNKYILPYSGRSAFHIDINASLVAVGEIDEVEEKLSTVLWLKYQWNDENIHWAQDENKITDVTFGWTDVWKPVLRVDNPHADSSNRQTADRSFDSVIYNSSGTAWFDEMMVTRTTCDLDMTYYPFDIQSCLIKLSVVGESKFPLHLHVLLDEYLSSSDSKHGSWVLIHKSTTASYGRFQIELQFERRPLFILLNILLPIIVLALLTPTVFVLPKKSGERVGFSITMLLAISVYMTIVSDHLPQNSEPMPHILIMMFVWYIIDAVIVFIVIINSRINRTNESRPFPKYLRLFVILTHKVLFRTRKNTVEESGNSDESQKCMKNEKAVEEEDENQTQEGNGSDKKTCADISWKDLSHCIDRWCFAVFYLVKVTVPICFFIAMKIRV